MIYCWFWKFIDAELSFLPLELNSADVQTYVKLGLVYRRIKINEANCLSSKLIQKTQVWDCGDFLYGRGLSVIQVIMQE